MARKGVEPLTVYVPLGAKSVIADYTRAKRMSISDYVRDLIERDLRANGLEVDLGVLPGGPRPEDDKG